MDVLSAYYSDEEEKEKNDRVTTTSTGAKSSGAIGATEAARISFDSSVHFCITASSSDIDTNNHDSDSNSDSKSGRQGLPLKRSIDGTFGSSSGAKTCEIGDREDNESDVGGKRPKISSGAPLKYRFVNKHLPAPPDDAPDKVAAERIEGLLRQQAQPGPGIRSSGDTLTTSKPGVHASGFDLTESIRSKKAFANPYILSAVKDFFHIDEIGSAYDPLIFDPNAYEHSDFVDSIVDRYSDPTRMRLFNEGL